MKLSVTTSKRTRFSHEIPFEHYRPQRNNTHSIQIQFTSNDLSLFVLNDCSKHTRFWLWISFETVFSFSFFLFRLQFNATSLPSSSSASSSEQREIPNLYSRSKYIAINTCYNDNNTAYMKQTAIQEEEQEGAQNNTFIFYTPTTNKRSKLCVIWNISSHKGTNPTSEQLKKEKKNISTNCQCAISTIKFYA